MIDLDWAAVASSDAADSESDAQGPPVAFLMRSGGGEYPLYAGDNFIGRGESRDVSLDDPTVSDSHAIITCENDEVTIKDLKSRFELTSATTHSSI